MMLYPPMASLVDKVGSRYMLVNVVAHRAREISGAALESGEPLDKKPVSSAIDEIASGKLVVHFGEAGEKPTEAAEEAPAAEETAED